MEPDWQRFAQEARRVHARYLVEVVESFGLCPWAKEARLHGRLSVHVTPLAAADPRALLDEVDACMRDESDEVGMLICPRLALSRTSFRHLVAEVRAAEEQRRARGQQRFALADFHPNAPPNLTTADRLVPFLRRSPDPMLQIVRTDVLSRVRRSQDQGTRYVDAAQIARLSWDQLPPQEPSLAERVAQTNLRTLQRLGAARVEAVIRSIHEDRNRAYARLGLPIPTHSHIDDTS